MDIETTTTFLALLAIVAEGVVVLAVLLFVLGRFVPAVAAAGRSIRTAVGSQTVAFAAVVAAVCTAGSLYLSEVAHFPPCRLCWVQRGFMYPLVLILGLAAATRARALRYVGIAAAALGGCVSIYHMAIERNPELESSTTCDFTNPCSTIWIEKFGYLTIPTMALSGFALIITLLVLAPRERASEAS